MQTDQSELTHSQRTCCFLIA